ncbi:ATP-binding protein [Arcobacter sp. LA11]|uniref:ATP-binding protein n=1 Tax=Arcobacter sp. LA11 TaxID=1898176 RepID=UPI0009FB42C8|nr:ATP-binding protein [Arcobacter sp. LA11]
MRIINRFNIKSKLSILFIVLCCSVFIFGYIIIDISENSKGRLKAVYLQSQDVSLLQENIITPLYKLREKTQSLVMAPNKKLRVKIQYDLNLLIKELEKSFSNFHIEDEQTINLWDKYKKVIKRTNYYLQRGFEEGAYINVTTKGKDQFEFLINHLLNLQSELLNKAKTSYSNAVEESKLLIIEIIIYLLIILFFSIIIGWLISNSIITSMDVVQRGLNEFFEYLNYKKDKAQKIVIHSNDEFSQMAQSINQNFENVELNIKKNEELIKNATKVLQSIKSGNLGMRLTTNTNSKALNELKIMINNMIDNLEYKIQNEIDKRLEQEQILIQQSKLAAMGEMIGNIAHQWRQPLSQISAIHMNMLATYEFNEFTEEYLNEKIEEADMLTSYMTQTISDFQNFFNPEEKKQIFSVKEACNKACFIVKSALNYHNIELTLNVLDDEKVNGYQNEYSQVILNILSNAKDILLEREIKNPKIQIEIKSGEDYNILKIEDNAGGVDEDILDKIFEPYFTTHHKTQGTGIGLYMSKNIIEREMNGFINVKNTEVGACFTIKVPQ